MQEKKELIQNGGGTSLGDIWNVKFKEVGSEPIKKFIDATMEGIQKKSNVRRSRLSKSSFVAFLPRVMKSLGVFQHLVP